MVGGYQQNLLDAGTTNVQSPNFKPKAKTVKARVTDVSVAPHMTVKGETNKITLSVEVDGRAFSVNILSKQKDGLWHEKSNAGKMMKRYGAATLKEMKGRNVDLLLDKAEKYYNLVIE